MGCVTKANLLIWFLRMDIRITAMVPRITDFLCRPENQSNGPPTADTSRRLLNDTTVQTSSMRSGMNQISPVLASGARCQRLC